MAVDALAQSVHDLGRRVGRIEDAAPAVLASQLHDLKKDVAELADDVKGLRRILIGFAITVAASATGFAITVLLVWGGANP